MSIISQKWLLHLLAVVVSTTQRAWCTEGQAVRFDGASALVVGEK